ncbi:aromatic aminobenezylarsenical efflux permease ArsG family transporter [Candidatus Latescibacterota bacterium]
MIESVFAGVFSALWLGILTSISPCPLATNIAAVSYLARRVDSVWRIVLGGLLYTAGRMLTYSVLAFMIVQALINVTSLSMFLQNNMNRLLGPVLIVIGMVLLDMIPVTVPGFGIGEKFQERVDRSGLLGAGFLGILFSLSFCPVSAALFFGALIPVMMRGETSLMSGLLLPSLYGIGTGLPVLVFAFIVAFSMHAAGKVFARLQFFEKYARRITGVIFIVIGLYMSLKYIFGLFN